MFKFKVEFWDEKIQEYVLENGITDGETYGIAADHVCDYYGKENVTSMTLEELDNIILSDEVEHIFQPEVIEDNE